MPLTDEIRPNAARPDKPPHKIIGQLLSPRSNLFFFSNPAHACHPERSEVDRGPR